MTFRFKHLKTMRSSMGSELFFFRRASAERRLVIKLPSGHQLHGWEIPIDPMEVSGWENHLWWMFQPCLITRGRLPEYARLFSRCRLWISPLTINHSWEYISLQTQESTVTGCRMDATLLFGWFFPAHRRSRKQHLCAPPATCSVGV